VSTSNIVALNKENFYDVTSTENKLTIVDFRADWCAPCQAIAPFFDRLAEEYQDKLIIGIIDIDEQRELAMDFGISSIPTIQLYRNGVMIETLVGSRPYQDYKNLVDRNI